MVVSLVLPGSVSTEMLRFFRSGFLGSVIEKLWSAAPWFTRTMRTGVSAGMVARLGLKKVPYSQISMQTLGVGVRAVGFAGGQPSAVPVGELLGAPASIDPI